MTSNNLLPVLTRVNIPEIYKSSYGEICKADATAVDLGKLNKYFYELGRYVANFDRNGFVGKTIYEASGLSNAHVNNKSSTNHDLFRFVIFRPVVLA